MSFATKLKTDLKFRLLFFNALYLTKLIFINLMMFILAPLTVAIIVCVMTTSIYFSLTCYYCKQLKRLTSLQTQIQENADSNHVNISVVEQNIVQQENYNYDYFILANHSPKSMTYQVPALAPPTYDEAVQSTSETNLQVN